MTTPTRPPGYRAPTEEQLKKMPPGSLCLHHDENMHATWEPLAEFPSQADDWVFLAYQAGQLAVPDTKEVNYLNDFDPHTGRPNGYREPTDTDMECLPEGTLCWVSPRWVIHGGVGLPAKPGKGKKFFAVPDTKETKPSSPLAEQVGGDHYKTLAIQPVEYCQKNRLGYIESNVVKYVTRHRAKNGRQDIEKAIHNLNILLEMEYPPIL